METDKLNTNKKDLENKTNESNIIIKEIVNNNKNNKEVVNTGKFSDLFHFVEGKDKIIFAIAATCSIIQGLALPFVSLIMGNMINSLDPTSTREQALSSMNKNFYAMIGVGLFVLVIATIASILFGILSTKQSKKLKLIYFKRLILQSCTWYDKNKIDKISAGFIEQVSSFAAVFSNKMHLLFMNYAMAIGGLIVGLIKGWAMTLIIIGLTPFMLIFMGLFIKYLQKGEKIQSEKYASAGSASEECFSGIKVVKSLCSEEHEVSRYSNFCMEARNASSKFGFKVGITWGLFWLAILGLYSLSFLIGSRLIINRIKNDNTGLSYNVGDILTIFFGVITGVFSLGNIGPLQKTMETAKVAIFTILEIIKNPEEEINGLYIPEEFKGHLIFENITFSYPSSPEVNILKNVSFEIFPGERVGFVGPSGSGKSTIIQLIERFYEPKEGRILLDGRELKEYDLVWLRNKFGLVSQQPVLFADSLRFNLLFGLKNIENVYNEKEIDELIWESLKKVNGYDFIKKMEKELDTFVGSGGNQLSGGQKQRIAIARVLIRNPEFFLFDEATSALDRKNEADIQKTLDDLSKSTGSITIAHRLSTIKDCNKIFVLSFGELIEFGNHQELLDKNGFYAKLINAQLDTPVENELKLNHDEIENEKISENVKITNDIIVSDTKNINDISINTKLSVLKPTNIKIFDFMGNEKYYLLPALISSLANGAIMPVFGFLLGTIMDRLSNLAFFILSDVNPNSPDDLPTVIHKIDLIIIAMAVTAVGSIFTNFLTFSVFNYIGEKFTYRLRVAFFKRILYMDMDYFDKEENQPGALSSKLSLECRSINILVGTYIGAIIQSLSSFLTGLIIGLIFSWRISLIMLALSPLLMLSGIVEGSKLSNQKRNKQAKGSELLPETLNNLKVVRSLTATEPVYKKFEQIAEEDRKSVISSTWLNSFLFGVSQFGQFLIFGVVFRVGVQFQIDYNLNNNDLFVSMFAIIFGGFGAGMANQFIGGIGEAKASSVRILEEINSISKIEKSENYLNENKNINLIGKIKFDKVYFSYPGRDEIVLKNLSFEIPAGVSTAFVGPSGSGKSTIFQLLLRFYETTSGNIYIDGVNIKEINLKNLRSLFGVVRQEPSLFNGTLEYNIKYNSEANKEKILEALELSNSKEFVDQDPEGLNRDVGNRGEKLSGGQKQRIAIARVLVRDPKIFMFDEATSALDSKSETIVQEALEKISQEKGSITIAHRLNTIKNSDIIFVLEDGILVEHGKYNELLDKKGVFSKLVHG